MMKDHNLDDLIIDDIKPEKNKGKGILTIVALLITLLIVAIVLTRVFLSENDQNATTMEQKQGDMISPELIPDTSNKKIESDKKELEQLSSMMEETLTEKPAEPIKSETVQVNDAAEPAAAVSSTEETIAAKPAETENAPIQKPSEKVAPETTPKVAEAPVAAAKPAKPAKPAATKPARKPAPSKPKISSGSYYIQVGSFSKQPDKRFLSRITKNGFHYKLYKGKLLIGPYSSNTAVRRDLPRVKSKINKGAFVKHL